MVSPHNAPGDDGLSQLFGSVISDAVDPIETTEAPLTRRALRNGAAPIATSANVESPLAHAPLANLEPSSAVAPLSRREAREATTRVSKARAPKLKTTAAAAAPAPRPQVPRPEVFSYEGIEFPSHPAPQKRATGRAAKRAANLVASAPPVRASRTGLRKRVSSAATILAVTGFFAAVCIPAYAFGPVDELEAAPATLASKSDATLSVARDAAELNVARDSFSATTAEDLADARSSALKIANFEAYEKSGARELGDDYPWFSELSNNQGGGLSPLNYYYRECVDFVAWRLNRDAGSTEAPFKYDWNYLTPGGGSAYAWKRQWDNHGWPTGTTPKVGAVAWFGYHVSYVKSVNSDGTVTIEEYNHQSDHLYGQRTIPATDVTSYLYAPPR